MSLAVDCWMYPAWRPTEKGAHRVFALAGRCRVLADVAGDDLTLTVLSGDGPEPVVDYFGRPDGAASEVPEVATALSELGRLGGSATHSWGRP